MFRLTSAILGAALALSSAYAGETIKWVDKNGKVHYSDRQPPESEAKSVTTLKRRAGPAVAAAPAASSDVKPSEQSAPADPLAAFKERQVKKAEAEAKQKQEAQAAAEKQRNCQAAQNQVKQLEAGGRFTRAGANGETEFLDDKDIAQAKVDARKSADSWCKS